MIDLQLQSSTMILGNPTYAILFLLLMIWTFIWKGVALWKAARNNQKNWFVMLLILNTFGILEIIYIFYFSQPNKSISQ